MSYSRRVYNWFYRKWIFSFIITALPGGILAFLGVTEQIDFLSFLYVDGYMKTSWVVFFSICWFLSACLSFEWHRIKRREERYEANYNLVYKKAKTVLEKYHMLCHEKLSSVIRDGKYKGSVREALGAISNKSSRLNPIFKMGYILDCACELFSYVFGIDEDDFTITIIYKEDKNSDWVILHQKNYNDHDNKLKAIMENPNSTYRSVLVDAGWDELFMKKSDAVKAGKYVPSIYENAHGLKGSIYCKNLSVYNEDRELIKGFIFAVSTKTMQFGRANDNYSTNICRELFRLIENILKPEIDHIYMNDYFNLEEFLNEKNYKYFWTRR